MSANEAIGLDANKKRRLGIIGGSGFYNLPGLENARTVSVSTPFGEPSDDLILGDIGTLPIAFLPRHGRGHRILPTEVNVRANIYALKSVGCTEIVSFSAAGSLAAGLPPGTFVLPTQFIDRTFARSKTFFGDGIVGHVAFADPVCNRLGDVVNKAASEIDIECARGGSYVVMEGPQFSTRAECELYRSWGASIIGMTALPEAKLAREAELCYTLVAMVTDFDCWHDEVKDVTAHTVAETMAEISKQALSMVAGIASHVSQMPVGACEQGCGCALDGAIMTDPAAISPQVEERLAPILNLFKSMQPCDLSL